MDVATPLTSPAAPPAPAPPAAVGEPVIALRGATKLYARTEARADTLKQNMLDALARKDRRNLVVALEDVDLEIRRGEAVGLIGPNGSGKSTLLKLIAGISEPTRGSVTAAGRVIGMIELGTGFHPDLTGEENVHLQGSIYGLTKRQIDERMDAILDFAELRDFRHLPVKHYSSGMFVRLGFAIAVHTEPDVLLVDEVLAVGDQNFQERCLSRIREMLAAGVTLVFVTHVAEQAERVCERVVWLEGGRIHRQGAAAHVLADYHNDLLLRRHAASQGRLDTQALSVGMPGRFGDGRARIEAVRLLDTAGRPRTTFRRGEALAIEVDYSAAPDLEAVDCMIPMEFVPYGMLPTLWRAQREAAPGRPVAGRGRFRMDVTELTLLPGRYCLTIALAPPDDPYAHYDVLYKLFHFTIESETEWDTVGPVELKSHQII